MHGVVLRAARTDDIEDLLGIERRAAVLLLGHGGFDLMAMHSLVAQDLSIGTADGWLQVAEQDGRAIGFALCGELDGHVHLYEMDVLPEHGRVGVGSALLEAMCQRAVARGHARMTLVTLRDVPWNAPFYASRGFEELPESEWHAGLRAVMARERGLGFPTALRVVMQRCLEG